MHRNVNIEIVRVQAAADDEHLNPITTVKPDVIEILRADRGIVMGEWIKTQYTDVHLNLDRIFACGCYFHAGKCQPHQTEFMLAQLMETQAPDLATAESIVVGSRVHLTCGGVFQICTVSRIKDGEVNENQISLQMQDRLVEVGQSRMARAEKVDGFVLEKVDFFHQGTNRITSHQDWRDILAPGKIMTDKILGTVLTVSIYGHSKKLQLPASLAKTWILDESFWNKWNKVNTQEKVSGRRWVYLEEEPVRGNEVPSQEIEANVDKRQRNKKITIALPRKAELVERQSFHHR